ncbi:hypothetical protein ACEPAI_3679 [Sanghuangporus weigelae]
MSLTEDTIMRESELGYEVTVARLISKDFVTACIVYARQHAQSSAVCPTDSESELSQLSLLSDYASSTSSNSPPYVVSKLESMFYYSGISPTPPKLVYRTGSSKMPWVKPTRPESYRKLKQARGVFGHKLNVIWKAVGPLVRDLLRGFATVTSRRQSVSLHMRTVQSSGLARNSSTGYTLYVIRVHVEFDESFQGVTAPDHDLRMNTSRSKETFLRSPSEICYI